ncbi:N(G),N(G)-dimethylarginine dimethylaminohydrolase 1-like [Macrosteles quadrilineatus]|uniref:N(G),N(G)-dimethylarginine dimethylaminohydrolase 1-like n=1 Tax=Macrosteles quadrilineatus TaxID=74068 RepID=UPI0023E3487F|nr:N(G),N(G)-dimethylarginine dimethylaminohydrolase 1-like [Macrosteles quadrilineatus]
MASLKYTHAVVSRIPNSFKSKDINFEEAKRQHENYVRLLRNIGLDVIELPPDESLPECVFVEDTAVVCNGIALITRPGNPARLKEVETIRAVLKKELDLPIVEISDENAKLDGGDVLFTGREFFVGLSKWTNEAGAKAVAAAFPEYPCTPIKVGDTQHLKYMVSMAGPDVFCISMSKSSQEVLKRIQREATYGYQILTVPEEAAANVLYINGTLIHRADEEIPESAKVFYNRIDFSRHAVNVSELAKTSNSGLSSCCLLLRRSRHIRSL